MIEERFRVGKWHLVDIVFGEGICENCRKPITYLYFIEDERGNKCTVGSECFKQIAKKLPPRARQYIDLKERVLRNVDTVFKYNTQAIEYKRNLGERVEEPGLASLATPYVLVDDKWISWQALQLDFKAGKSGDPRFDVEEETINELLKLGWREYQAPRGAFGHETDRFIILNPKTAQQLEKALIKEGWKGYSSLLKRLNIGYYREQKEPASETPRLASPQRALGAFGIREKLGDGFAGSNDVMKLMVRGYTWKARMSNGAVFEWWTPMKVGYITAKEELLKIANGEYGDVYTSRDIVSIWETKGGI